MDPAIVILSVATEVVPPRPIQYSGLCLDYVDNVITIRVYHVFNGKVDSSFLIPCYLCADYVSFSSLADLRAAQLYSNRQFIETYQFNVSNLMSRTD